MPETHLTVVAAFDDRVEAEKAVDELEHSGFSPGEVGMALRGSDVVRGGMISDQSGAKDIPGAKVGIATGAGLGAILGAAGALLVPGVGPVVVAGVFALAFGGAIAGAAIGGIFGALTGLGVSEEEARYYEKEFSAGKAIVAVQANGRADLAREILARHGGYNMQSSAVSPVKTEGIFSEP